MKLKTWITQNRIIRRFLPMLLAALALLAASAQAAPVVALDNYHNNEDLAPVTPLHYYWEGTDIGGFSTLKNIVQSLGGVTNNLTSAFSAGTLAGIDVLVIVDPDTASEAINPKYITVSEADAAYAWVTNGGVLILLNNAGTTAEKTYCNGLASRFGITFDSQSYNTDGLSPIPSVPRWDPLFVNCSTLFFHSYCTMAVTSPAVVRLLQNGSTGSPVMATASVGKGVVPSARKKPKSATRAFE